MTIIKETVLNLKAGLLVGTLFFICEKATAQSFIHIKIDASYNAIPMSPIWRDHYENSLMDGYGSNPALLGSHKIYSGGTDFREAMQVLKPRYIRISLGRMDNPPDTAYFSSNPNTLRHLKYEFYSGKNTLDDADDPENYHFEYIDSAISLIQSIGAIPFITMDYMPYTLSRDTTPEYQAAMGLVYSLAYDNSIRNSPPADPAVYGRVMYHLIKHCYSNFGVTYFEHWNEPDQQWLNPIMVKFFWKGDGHDLYDAYAAIANQVSADSSLSNVIKLGGCSFAFYSLYNSIPIYFLQAVQQHRTKFDFLSFHPYSDTQYKGGYDTAKVELAIEWRNRFVPGAELINAEWGRLDTNTDVWGDLDYGLNKFRHIIDMLDRGISMSHEVCLFDPDSYSDNFTSLGMFRVGPIIPKPSAFVFFNLNRLNATPNRLTLSLGSNVPVLAGISDARDKIVVAFPADTTNDEGTDVLLEIRHLPWGEKGYSLNRYEVTEASCEAGLPYVLTSSLKGSGDQVFDTLNYHSVKQSGRLIIWEISADPTGSADNLQRSSFRIFPNPTDGDFSIISKNQREIDAVSIYNLSGRQIYKDSFNQSQKRVHISTDLPPGVYILKIQSGKVNTMEKFIRLK